MIPSKRKRYKNLQELYNHWELDDDIQHPLTFTGKINWNKINGDLNVMAKLADKQEVKAWIQEKLGEKYLIKTLGVWKKDDDIDFDSLPNQFVLKANFGSGFVYIVRDKAGENLDRLKRILDKWLHTTLGWYGLEIHYFGIPRRIIAEEYVTQIDGNLLDYKVHCFDGKPTFIQVIGNRNLDNHTGMQANYDFNWNRLEWIFEDYPAYPYPLPKPSKLNEIYSVSEKLCEGFNYVRVDLYQIADCVKFGEMTFTPGNGRYPYKGTWNRELDKKYGAMIPLTKDSVYKKCKRLTFLCRAEFLLYLNAFRKKLKNRGKQTDR